MPRDRIEVPRVDLVLYFGSIVGAIALGVVLVWWFERSLRKRRRRQRAAKRSHARRSR